MQLQLAFCICGFHTCRFNQLGTDDCFSLLLGPVDAEGQLCTVLCHFMDGT